MKILSKLKCFIILIIFTFISFQAFSDATDDSPDDEKSEDDSWIYNYINIDASDDIFQGFKLKNHELNKEYIKNLKWNQDIDFFIDDIDQFNLRKNINSLARFPYIFKLYGGYSYNRGFDIGFLFRADNIADSFLALTTAASFGQNNRFWFLSNLEYPAFFGHRIKLLGTLAFFTSAPQFASHICIYPKIYNQTSPNTGEKLGNLIMRLFNTIWRRLGITFNKYRDFGFVHVGGVDFRVPFLEMNLIVTYEFFYKYVHVYDATDTYGLILSYDELPDQVTIEENHFNFNPGLELRWNKFKQTTTLPVGNNLSLKTKFYIPTNIGNVGQAFRFKSRIEEKFNKKLFRELAFKFRMLIVANYNISEDFSGDPYIRGFADNELTGWFALLSNIEAYIPLIDFNIIQGPDQKILEKTPKFILYLNLFVDGGFTIDNFDYPLDGFNSRLTRELLERSMIAPWLDLNFTHLGYNHYLLPALSVGGGLQFYSYFLHFILRFDVGVNLIKAAVYQRPEQSVEFIFSFNQMF